MTEAQCWGVLVLVALLGGALWEWLRMRGSVQ